MLPYIVVPAAVLTVVTFLFVYRQRRLPGVYSLLVAIGWLAYIVTQAVRPTLMAIGPAPWGLVTVAELLDMAAWIVIFLGFVLKPPFARHHNMPKTPDAEEPAILAPQTT
ncbi:MAG TPA: hypothetical protein VKK79_13200 [Candidatus Lokiarchaeia archaeon]|nr:hypothetical protein [Candidatus Lokiarchaeia archaeon]